ncbi:MAG TPA: hydrogenase maturation nickel metallochaperone HypA [Ignavibacteria bacterium]|jgi:hydrogenase nickel incorporation protein HypA/HybF
MHELSLAQDIVEIVYQNVPANEISRVKNIVIKVGEFSGVAADSLKFSFQAVTSKSELENTDLEIINTPFELKCNACGQTSSNEFGMMICTECGSNDTKTISGNELEVIEIKINSMEEVI